MVILDYGIVIWNCAKAISFRGLDILFFMSLPHFYPTMAFFNTTNTLFFLIMAQIYVFGTFLYPIKRVTLFRHVLGTQICGLVMFGRGTVILRCATVMHFFMTMPHSYMCTTTFHMINPHIKWLWHFILASVISKYGEVVIYMYLFMFFSLPCHFLCWLCLEIKWLGHFLKWTWRKHKWIKLSFLWQWHLIWLCQIPFVAQSFNSVATSLH